MKIIKFIYAFFAKKDKKLPFEVFISIKTLTMDRWIEIEKSNNLNFLFKTSFDVCLNLPHDYDNKLAEIYEQFIFQFDDLNLKKIKLEAAIIYYEYKQIMNYKPAIANKLKRMKLDLEVLKNKQLEEIKPDYLADILTINRWQQFNIKPSEMTVSEFLKLKKQCSEYYEKQNELQKNK